MHKVFLSQSTEETQAIGATFAKELRNGDFVAFYGDLGAGKTAFIRGAVLALIPDAPVQSPTIADAQSPAAVVSPFTFFRFVTIIVPAPIKPIPAIT